MRPALGQECHSNSASSSIPPSVFLDIHSHASFKIRTSARAKTKDAHRDATGISATRAPRRRCSLLGRDFYHKEHHGVSCTDFYLKPPCGKLFVIIAFLAQGTALPALKATVPVRTALPMCASMPANNTMFETPRLPRQHLYAPRRPWTPRDLGVC